MTQQRQNLLVALDISGRTTSTINYLAEIVDRTKAELVLFHLFNCLPDGIWDVVRNPSLRPRLTGVKAWAADQRKKAERVMANSRRRLLRAGFSPDDISICVRDIVQGEARDILVECSDGYSALVLGRRGMISLRGLELGSVANKIISQASDMPLWLVGKGARAGGLLLALDGSPNSWRAVKYLARSPVRHDQDILIINVQRNGVLTGDSGQPLAGPRRQITKFMDRAARVLELSGFNAQHINTKVLVGQPSRAKAIVELAQESDSDTIILGRWGVTDSKQFSMGKVTGKVSQLAKGLALWIVN